jgi:hypothetical protein
MKPLCKLLAFVVVLLMTFPVGGQQKPASEPKPKSGEASKSSDPWQRRLPELNLQNIPLAEVVNMLAEKDQFPEINVICDQAVKDTAVTLKLRSVTLDDIFTALEIATQSGGSIVDPASGLPSQLAVQANKISDRMVSLSFRQTPPIAPVTPVCRAFSLSRYLAGKSSNEIESALKEIEDTLNLCWDMLKKADRTNTKTESPQLRLHPGTKLLIVVGQENQVAVVAQVLEQLDQGMVPSIDPATGLPGLGGGAPAAAGFPSTPNPNRYR